jgi:hypothetical protein
MADVLDMQHHVEQGGLGPFVATICPLELLPAVVQQTTITDAPRNNLPQYW